MSTDTTQAVLLGSQPGLSGYAVLGAVVREFRDKGYNSDRIPRVMRGDRCGINVRITKGVGLRVSCPIRGGDVTVEVVSGKQVLKDGKALADTSGAAVVGLAQELLREASI